MATIQMQSTEVRRQVYDAGSGEANSSMWDLDVLNSSRTPFKWEHLVAFIIVVLSLVAGRWIYDGFFRLLR